MPLITETYYLSLTQDNRGILRLRCSQDDTLRTVNLKLYNNGSIFTIPSGISAYISGVKQNGAVFSKSCTISQDRKSVVLQLSSDITNVDGVIIAEIVLNDGNGDRLGTSNFIIQVEKNPIRAGVIQDTETPIEYVNDFITQIQALTARVNNLITPKGDPSLAEVVDARISSLDGNTYQNLKARIDADIATLNACKANKSEVYTKSQVDDLLANIEIDVDDELSDESENPVQNKAVASAISEIKADLSEKEEIEYTAEGYYINTNLQYAEVDNPRPSSTGFKYAIVDCSEGDKFIINAVGGSGERAWAFANASNLILSVADENATVANLVLTAPNGTAKLIINNKGTGISYKLGAFITDRVSNLEEKIDNFEPLSDNIKMALLECFQNVAWIGADSKTYYDNLVNALYQSIYSIDVPTTFNGASDYIDTGIQLFDTDKSFTIFCDCTEDTEYPLLRYYQMFHCMMSNSPWTGIEASLRQTDENDKSPIRIAYYGGAVSQSYDSTTGVGNRNVKIAVSHKSASSSLSIAVSVNDNLVTYEDVVYSYGFNEKTLVIGVAKRDDGTLTSNFFKGTINNFKLYNVSFSLNDLRNMVLNGGTQ